MSNEQNKGDVGTTNVAGETDRLGGMDPVRGEIAPQAHAPETGTPQFAKGPNPSVQQGVDHELNEEERAQRASATPGTPPSRGTEPGPGGAPSTSDTDV